MDLPLCTGCQQAPVNQKKSRYCSHACYLSTKWAERVCLRCSVSFMALKSQVSSGRRKYCSLLCSIAGTTKRPGIEKFGVKWAINFQGYYASRSRPHRLLHRYTWEKLRGKIPDGYVVHHKDGNKLNNNIENLEPMEWGAHTALEHLLHPRTPPRTARGVCHCGAISRCWGMCSMHYQRERKRRIRNNEWPPQK